ncbi:PulJ/GspJ family protein [Arenicella xantha]|uniref:Prepilin-type N-terminal cleavage/methylation domain-containing protein n=1 Tax=Arenicella xantha TaxID=644221 RepID=A0A395JFT2_9GAMM|nr:prepilin-type N-terminal cleavage/methylation domain-containing protein [Arenicella xantha]RBP47142.1 prepilin-type N-terminal cleavage/methylation domain-containing protein [Arenicella xantha]
MTNRSRRLSIVIGQQTEGRCLPGSFMSARQVGFTLVEFLLVLSLFAMLSLIAYQAIADVVNAKRRIQQEVMQQTERRITHRTLQLAALSGAKIGGNHTALTLNFESRDADWLSGANTVLFRVSNEGMLQVQSDLQDSWSVLMSGLQQAGFRYVMDGVELDAWQGDEPPQQIVFYWRQHGEFERWRFALR